MKKDAVEKIFAKGKNQSFLNSFNIIPVYELLIDKISFFRDKFIVEPVKELILYILLSLYQPDEYCK